MAKTNVRKKSSIKVKESRQVKEMRGRLDDMGEDMEVLNRHNTSKKRKRSYSDDPRSGTILKPRGTAGKGGNKGYNLQSAMGLADKEEVYLCLLSNVRKSASKRGIDTSKTITQNRTVKVAQFITWCQVKWNFFKRFEDGWAVRDILASYLVNQQGARKKQRMQMKAAGIDMKGVKSDCDSEGEQDEQAESENNDSGHDMGGSEIEIEDTRVSPTRKRQKMDKPKQGTSIKIKIPAPQGVHSSAGRPKKTGSHVVISSREDAEGDSGYEFEYNGGVGGEYSVDKEFELEGNDGAPNNDRDSAGLHSNSKGRKVNTTGDKSPAAQAGRSSAGRPKRPVKLTTITSSDDENDSDSWSASQSSHSLHDSPLDIPQSDSDDASSIFNNNVPPSKARKGIRTASKISLASPKHNPIVDQKVEPKAALPLPNVKPSKPVVSKSHGAKSWLGRVSQSDFLALADEVWHFKATLDPFMEGPSARKNHFIWTDILDGFLTHEISSSILNKGKKIPAIMVATAQPGRYGERGCAVIRNTLEHMYNITPEMTAASKPLTMDAYLTFFIIPLLAASFIAKDKDTNVEGGWESMVREDTDRHPSMKVDKFLEVVRTSNSVRCNKHAMVAPTSSEGNNKENDDPLIKKPRPKSQKKPDIPKPAVKARSTRSTSNKALVVTMEDFPPPTQEQLDWKKARTV